MLPVAKSARKPTSPRRGHYPRAGFSPPRTRYLQNLGHTALFTVIELKTTLFARKKERESLAVLTIMREKRKRILIKICRGSAALDFYANWGYYNVYCAVVYSGERETFKMGL